MTTRTNAGTTPRAWIGCLHCYNSGRLVGDWSDAEDAAEWARVILAVPEHQREALCAWVASGSYVAEGTGDLPSVHDFEERFCGTWGSFKDYAENLAEEIGVIPEDAPETLVRCFNWDAWTRDLEYEYTVVRADSLSVYIFRDL